MAPVITESAASASDVVALVDVDNVTGIRARTRNDARQMLFDVARAVHAVVGQAFPAAAAAEVRLYGGWADNLGRDNDTAVNLLAELTQAARLWRTTLRGKGATQVFRLVDRPDGSTVRSVPFVQRETRDCCGTTKPGQKMVDTTLSTDIATLGSRPGQGLLVMSSDRDMLPGLLVASSMRQAAGGRPRDMLIWHRPSTPLKPHEQGLSSIMTVLVA